MLSTSFDDGVPGSNIRGDLRMSAKALGLLVLDFGFSNEAGWHTQTDKQADRQVDRQTGRHHHNFQTHT